MIDLIGLGRKSSETMAADLHVHPSRLPAAKRAAKLLGIHVTELPALAAELEVSATKIIAACSDKRPSPAGKGRTRGQDRAHGLMLDVQFAREHPQYGPVKDHKWVLFAK
jgi:hypothetical protein